MAVTEGGTERAPAAARSRIGASLRHRNYRLFFFGQLVSMIGTWMQTVAQSFLVLELTHSGTQLGLTIGARFLPVLIFGQAGVLALPAGVRIDHCGPATVAMRRARRIPPPS